jgi:outer membrane biosynthesis protein TonB
MPCNKSPRPERVFALSLIVICALATACRSGATVTTAYGVLAPSPAPDTAVTSTDGSITYLDFQVDKQAKMLRNQPTPAYPSALKVRNIEGRVEAQFLVDTAGRVDLSTFKLINADSTKDAFVDAVKEALARTRYSPAEIRGRKVRQLVQQSFYFTSRH